MRLDKYICCALNITRSEASVFLKKNEVIVNNKRMVKKDFKISEENDEILINGIKSTYRRFVYYMLNNPQNVVSATADNFDKTVVELIDTQYEIFPIGRLDKDSVGLLILTNDGATAHYLTNPNHHIEKEYEVVVDVILDDKELYEFQEGVLIRDGNNNEYLTKRAKINYLSANTYRVIINEGKFHQIKRMFQYFGKKVISLKRIRMGKINLDPLLKAGESRLLTDEEINILKKNNCQVKMLDKHY